MKLSNTKTTQKPIFGKLWITLVALLMLCATAGVQSLQAQEKTRIIVEPDDFPLEIGALNKAIEDNGGDVIYVLRNGKTYFLENQLGYQHPLHIEAEEFPSDNPPIIRRGTDLLGASGRISFYRDDVDVKGVMFFGLDDFGGKTENQRSAVQDIHMKYQHSYFVGGRGYFWWLGATGNTVRVEDSFFANAGRHTSVPNQRFIDTRGNDTDSLIVINSSIYQINFHLIRSGGAVINHVYMDHVTVVNHSLSSFDLHLAREITIKNSLFHNVALDGDWESAELVGDAGPGYDGPRYFSTGGFIGINLYADIFEENPDEAPMLDSERTIVIKNNNFGGLPAQQYLDLWTEVSNVTRESHPSLGRGSYPSATDPAWRWANPDIEPDNPIWALRDTIPLVRILRAPMDSVLTAWGENNEPWVTINNNIRENVAINDMPDSMIDVIRQTWFGTGDPFPHYDRWEDLIANPDDRYFFFGDGDPIDPTGPTAGWFRDLGFNSDSQSFQHAENGYPVGNLNYYPELRQKWGDGEVLVSVERAEEVPADFRLVGNFPNPFNPTTNIVFELGTPDNVTMEVFNVVGQRVANMQLGMKSAGQHTVTFDAANLSSGVYIVRMQVGSSGRTLVHSMTLLK
ncbi:MAG: T9SS type A sorting domain-containing protein [Bacteroidetes bacterium]|nr:T9SS type A sorting domain-containing protein [Bacteroidota bacterium]MCH8523996.1 T9SS type A sorting domain-containing protein [Balneolales bacterium]